MQARQATWSQSGQDTGLPTPTCSRTHSLPMGPHRRCFQHRERDTTKQNRQTATPCRANTPNEGHKQEVQGEKGRQWADCMKHKNLEGRGGLTAPWLLPRPLQVATKDTGRMSTTYTKALGLVYRRREDNHRDDGSGRATEESESNHNRSYKQVPEKHERLHRELQSFQKNERRPGSGPCAVRKSWIPHIELRNKPGLSTPPGLSCIHSFIYIHSFIQCTGHIQLYFIIRIPHLHCLKCSGKGASLSQCYNFFLKK